MKRFKLVLGIIAFLTILTTGLSYAGGFDKANNDQQQTEVVNNDLESVKEGAKQGVQKFFSYTGFANATWGNMIMMIVGLIFIYLAIKYDYEPLLLIPIGTGIIIGNVPFFQDGGMNLQIGIYQEGSVLNYLYYGVVKGIYPPLIFLGIGAMTDFSSLISNP